MRSGARLQLPVRRVFAEAVVLISTMAAGILLGAAFVGAHDVRLDEAFAALQKAAALVDASSVDDVSHHTQNTFDRHIRKALANIQDAMDDVAAAAVAADADGGSQ